MNELRQWLEERIEEYNIKLDKAENQDQRNYYYGCLAELNLVYAKLLVLISKE